MPTRPRRVSQRHAPTNRVLVASATGTMQINTYRPAGGAGSFSFFALSRNWLKPALQTSSRRRDADIQPHPGSPVPSDNTGASERALLPVDRWSTSHPPTRFPILPPHSTHDDDSPGGLKPDIQPYSPLTRHQEDMGASECRRARPCALLFPVARLVCRG